MKCFLRIFAAILVALITLCGDPCLAQSKPKPKLVAARTALPADSSGGTMVKKAPVYSKDEIVTLQTDATPRPAVSALTVTAEKPENSEAEISLLRQQLKDKQKQVELLMRMFNTDERTFLIDPSGQTGDGDAAAKRRYEQEELRKTAAEVAALRARLDTLLAAAETQATEKR